jgi:hypothetical protein
MCDTCVTDPDIDVAQVVVTPAGSIARWLVLNDLPGFLRFVIADYPDVIAEYINGHKKRLAHDHLAAHAGGN